MAKVDTSKYILINDVSEDEMPRGRTWAFISLPKRGKTTGSARFNPSGSPEKTLFLDLENCVSHYPQFKGLNIINIGMYHTPQRPKKDESGKEILDKNNNPVFETVPLKERNYYVAGKPTPIFSVIETIAIIKQMAKDGTLQKYESVVLDTVDILQYLCEEATVDEYNARLKSKDNEVSSVGEIGEWGSGWDVARKKVMSIIYELKSLTSKFQLELCLPIHSKTTTQLKGKTQRDPALRQGLALALFGQCDLIGYIDQEPCENDDGDLDGTVFRNKVHTISFITNSEELTGGTRLGALVGKTFPFSYKIIKQSYERK